MNSKNTKRALLTSVLAMVVCLAMLVGSTFAWFTDTASTGVNKIQAGNLDIELSYKNNSTGGEFKKADKNTSVFNDDALWEPGHVEYAVLKIRNAGSLALKYKLGINIAGEAGSTNIYNNTFNLSDYIRFAVLNDDQSSLGRDNLVAAATDSKLIKEGYSKEDHLFAGENNSEKIVTLVVWMPTTVGNEANYKTDAAAPSIDLGITVYATQDTVENDSFDNKYDKYAAYSPSGAMYTVTNYEEAKNAFASGGGITIAEYIEADATKTEAKDRLVIKYPSVIDLNAAVHVPGSLEATANWATFFINADTTINASQAGGILCTDKLNPAEGEYKGGPYVAHVSGDGIVVTVNGGTYHGGGTVFNVEKGTLIVNDGFFQVTPDVDTNDCRYVLNCIDANYKNGTANIIVNGGTFVNFDPSNNAAEGAGTNFVADGHSVIKETQANGDVWYTVVAA